MEYPNTPLLICSKVYTLRFKREEKELWVRGRGSLKDLDI